MKRTLALILSLVMLVGTTACGEKTAEQPANQTSATEGASTTATNIDATQSEQPSETTVSGSASSNGVQTPTAHKHTIVIDAAVAATCQKTGLTEGSHCAVCGQVLKAQGVVAKTDHNYKQSFTAEKHTIACSVCNLQKTESHTLSADGKKCLVCSYEKETPPTFSKGYFSTQKTYIETEHVLYEIDPNIYIIGDLVERTNEVCKAIEAVTELKFNNSQYGGKKILVCVYREGIPRKDSEMSAGASFAESGPSKSSRGDDCMHIIRLTSPCALFTGKTDVFVHELAHTLRYSQTTTHFTTLLEEGFAEYVTYETIRYLEQKKSSAGFLLGSTIGTVSVFELMGFNYQSQNLLHWLSLSNEQFGGNQYPLGACLMAYLDSNYQNFTSWIKNSPGNSQILSGEAELQLLKKSYGDTFESALYSWIKANPKMGEATGHYYNPYSKNTQNLVGYAPLNFYPDFSNYGRFCCTFANWSFKYKDLYINLEEAKHFLKDYKRRNIDNLYLTLSDNVAVQYFDKNGVMLLESNEKVVNVAGVSYIKLVGSGYIGQLELVGYYDKNMNYKDGQVIFTDTVDDASDGRNEFLTTANASEAMEFAWDTELAYSKEYTLVLQLSDTCCEVTTYDLAWQESVVKGKKEIVISDLRYFAVYNPGLKPVTAKIIVKKIKR